MNTYENVLDACSMSFSTATISLVLWGTMQSKVRSHGPSKVDARKDTGNEHFVVCSKTTASQVSSIHTSRLKYIGDEYSPNSRPVILMLTITNLCRSVCEGHILNECKVAPPSDDRRPSYRA